MTHIEFPFPDLLAIDRLDVGPVRIEPARLVAPYTVIRGDQQDTTELIYRYEESVFQTDEPVSQNLACMIAAQVALNYGLFCKTIRFFGAFSQVDKKYLREALENTSREIYVKKILQDNPFLVGTAADLPPRKLDRYTQARIEFVDDRPTDSRVKWNLWTTDKKKHAILSSGGKDSLLTFGLLNEMQLDVFPIYINESGRHWFTALNAYRHFREHHPNTGRVWTNSDRVFNWMLRHLPFIRKDYSTVRADEYPIRLWTVAVFLFGALPLMRKHGIGRLLIGDEFDTTVRTSHKGIPHYDGLYDQSRYFDNQLSRYFMRKGWSISQFSILRPLSELLIEKVLVERYPNLQALQVSCHAAHESEHHIYPCGKCEKCRRIISMLTALGADPRHCGYTEAQIANGLQSVAAQGLHQEAEGVQQLFVMLHEQGHISLSPQQLETLQAHPAILNLRYDSERSPLDGIPGDLRLPLLNILLEHANGAVKRLGRKWQAFDPRLDPAFQRPFVFETETTTMEPGTDQPSTIFWGELTWPEAEKRLQLTDIALLPVGAIEQHGPHLPLDTDAFDAEYLARRVASACSDAKPLVLPAVHYGVSYHHEDFAGTLSISNSTLSSIVHDIGMGAARNGIKKLVIINGHGGNAPALNYAAQLINRDAHIFVAVDTGETSDVDIDTLTETPNDVHAGEIETSTSLAIRPHLVKMQHATEHIPRFSSRYLDFSSKRGITWHAYTNKITESGVMGDPTKASAEKGEKMWQMMIAHLVALVEDLKSISLDELYQRRY